MSAVRLTSSKGTSAEDLLAMQLAAAGQYTVTRQYRYAPPRQLRADFLVEVNSYDHGLLVEVQGGVYTRQAHGSVTGVLADIDRLNAATIAGYRMLRVTPQMIDSGEAMNLIERALGAV